MLKFADDTKIYHIVQSPKDIAVRSPQTSRMVQGLVNALLQLAKEEKDLGVTVSADMKWQRQCIEAVKKANKMLGLIKRNFQDWQDKSKDAVMPLYKSLVKPHLEYCCQVQSPYLSKDINLNQGVQRRATKLMMSDWKI